MKATLPHPKVGWDDAENSTGQMFPQQMVRGKREEKECSQIKRLKKHSN